MSLEQKASMIEFLRGQANADIAIELKELEAERIPELRAKRFAGIEQKASLLKVLGIYTFKQAIFLEGHALFVFNSRESALPHPGPEGIWGG